MGVGAGACCGGAGRDKGTVHMDPVLAAAMDLSFGPEQDAARDLQTHPRQFLFPAAGEPQLADEFSQSLHQENRWLGKSHQRESRDRMAEAHIVSGVQVPTPLLQEFRSPRLLEANKVVAKANSKRHGLESAKSPAIWQDARSSMSTEERSRSSNQSSQPTIGVRSVTLDFGLSARAAQASVPDPPLAWAASNTPAGFEQHESAHARAAGVFGPAQLMRHRSTPLGRQTSSGSGNGGNDAEWSGMAKRIQQEWNDANAEKRRRVFESAKLEDKLANYFQQQLIKERTGEGAVSSQERSVPRKCGKIAIVDKALEIRLAQQRLKAEGKAVS